jgi:hypothetical protein
MSCLKFQPYELNICKKLKVTRHKCELIALGLLCSLGVGLCIWSAQALSNFLDFYLNYNGRLSSRRDDISIVLTILLGASCGAYVVLAVEYFMCCRRQTNGWRKQLLIFSTIISSLVVIVSSVLLGLNCDRWTGLLLSYWVSWELPWCITYLDVYFIQILVKISSLCTLPVLSQLRAMKPSVYSHGTFPTAPDFAPEDVDRVIGQRLPFETRPTNATSDTSSKVLQGPFLEQLSNHEEVRA